MSKALSRIKEQLEHLEANVSSNPEVLRDSVSELAAIVLDITEWMEGMETRQP